MRRSYYDYGWMLAEDSSLLGLSLGYDRCAEHEWGISPISDAFGLEMPEFPLGVSDRQVRCVPAELVFIEFETKPRDKRRKAYPCALLAMRDFAADLTPSGVAAFVQNYDMSFHGEIGDKDYRKEQDICASWNKDGFAVQVRGTESIERLRQLHQAFLALDIALALPWARSFFRGGLSFAVVSAMSADAKDSVIQQDIEHKELHEAAKATGIEDLLKLARKRYYALKPAWFDNVKDEVVFFLNPSSQDRYGFGWFTVQELHEWASEKGPVVRDKQLEQFAELPRNYNWGSRLLKGLNLKGIGARYHEKLVWLDEAKTVPGLRVRTVRASQDLLPDGNYDFEELMSKYAIPLEAAKSSASA